LLAEKDIPRPHAREVFCKLKEIGLESTEVPVTFPLQSAEPPIVRRTA
jgi:hypothetical protein